MVIHAHSKTQPGHERKYNIPKASGVAALAVGEQHGKLDIILRRIGQLQKNGGEDQLKVIIMFPIREQAHKPEEKQQKFHRKRLVLADKSLKWIILGLFCTHRTY